MSELTDVIRECADNRRAKKQPRMADLLFGIADELERLQAENERLQECVFQYKDDVRLLEARIALLEELDAMLSKRLNHLTMMRSGMDKVKADMVMLIAGP